MLIYWPAAGFIHCCRGRAPVIHFCKLAFILPRSLPVTNLFSSGLNMLLPHRLLLLRPWALVHAAGPVKTCAVVYSNVVDHCTVNIGVVHNSCIHIYYRSVIPEVVAFPHASIEAMSYVAITIINPSVETHVRAPITRMKYIHVTFITPISRHP